MVSQQELDDLVSQISIIESPTSKIAEQRLIEIGEPATEYLIDLLLKTTQNISVTVGQVKLIQLIHAQPPSSKAAQKLINVLRVADENTSLYIYSLFAPIGTEKTVKELIKGLQNKYLGEHRYWFALALGHMQAKSAISPLIELLEDSNESSNLRGAAASALGDIGDTKAAKPIRQILEQSQNPNLQGSLILALGNIGRDEDGEYLLKALQISEYDIGMLIDALGFMGYENSVPDIIPYLQSEDARIRSAAIQALGFIGDDHAKDPLKKLRLTAPDHIQRAVDISLKNIQRGGRKKR